GPACAKPPPSSTISAKSSKRLSRSSSHASRIVKPSKGLGLALCGAALLKLGDHQLRAHCRNQVAHRLDRSLEQVGGLVRVHLARDPLHHHVHLLVHEPLE